MIVFAHRGSPHSPIDGNSRQCLTQAAQHGFGIEIDVRMTRDAHPVLQHDPMTWRGGLRFPLAQRGRTTARRGLATLDDALALDVPVLVDAKTKKAARHCADVLAALPEHRRATLWILHDDLDLLGEIVQRHPGVQTVHEHPADDALSAADHARYLDSLEALGVRGQNTTTDWWSPARIEAVHARGLLAMGSLAHDDVELARAQAAGIDGICAKRAALGERLPGPR